ncbi:A24 family peptidase [Gorillibacterium sp. sgz500922]|uniref:A24 family peptidase n=1 Tax=Gorillibacterium sp. sgz500922 TaxID=3446694 RepID=UPI003F67198C
MSWILLGALVMAAAYTDLRGSRIPNGVTLSGAGAGILLQGISGGLHGAGSSLLGLAVGFVPLFLLYLIGALGGGDVKLFAAIGAISGGAFALNCAIYALLIAGLIGIGILAAKKLLRPGLKRIGYSILSMVRLGDFQVLTSAGQKNMLRFPFMYAVLPAVLLMIVDQLAGKGWSVL